jgi:hypothetical protein
MTMKWAGFSSNTLMTVAVIVAVAAVVLVAVWYNSLYTYKKSRVDGRMYRVRNNSVAQESADLLANINIGIIKLREHILSLPPSKRPEYAERLMKFNPDSIQENILNIDTSYTINKGESVFFCIGSRDDHRQLYDINTLMYVSIHELAHIVSISVGHTDEFMKNFKDLLGHATDIGVYKYVDYSKSPQEYCGIVIGRNASDT